MFATAPRTANIIVADIGGTWIKFRAVVAGALLDDETIHPSSSIRTGDPAERLAILVRDFAKRCAIDDYVLVATIPGFIDHDFDRILHTPNIPELHDCLLASELKTRLGKPVLLERDAILALLGEAEAGVAKGEDFVLGIFFGTGIGAAFLVDGRPFRGSGWALEIGHLPCGEPGQILEDFASGRALSELAEQFNTRIESVFSVAPELPGLRQTLDTFISRQAKAISAAITFFGPRMVVLGGGVLNIEGFPRAQLLAEVSARLSPKPLVNPTICWSTLGWRSAAYGAARIVAEHLPEKSYASKT